MNIIDTTADGQQAAVQPISFARASVGFVTSTLLVSTLMVVLGSL